MHNEVWRALMAKYRNALPQLTGHRFISDGGLETTLVFKQGLEIPHFAAFHLLQDKTGESIIRRYFDPYIDIAKQHRTGLILETPTWRANPDWASRLGYTRLALDAANRKSVRLMEQIRSEVEHGKTQVVISGCIGPRYDAYFPQNSMTADEAERYHARQIGTFADTAADLVTAFTLTNADEAIGITRAAQNYSIPAVISFTLETDGRLPSGQTLQAAIYQVDSATDNGPAYFMINCAHPSHFMHVLADAPSWSDRIRCIRANASCRSHAELDGCETLDEGNPAELGYQYRELMQLMRNLNVLGGCCGTDHRHIAAIAESCL